MRNRKATVPVYFSSLDIENVRCFGETQHLDLTGNDGQPARWTLILGNNGVGKTTLLQCLAWTRLVPDDDPALFAEENEIIESLLRDGSSRQLALGPKLSIGTPLVPLDAKARGLRRPRKTIGTPLVVRFDTKRRMSSTSPKPGSSRGVKLSDPMVVAYGANRQLGVQNVAKVNLDDPIASRLSGLTELYDVEEILSGLDYASREKGRTSRESEHLKRLREVLTRILPGDFKPSDIQIFPPDVLDHGEPSGVHLSTFSGLVPMSSLSLGFQTTLAWTTDLAWRLLKRYPESSDPLAEPAVVLIDEIDLHLHPLWQLRIIDDLSALFPSTQFIATAHSPLIVQVAETANLVLLRARQTDVEIVNDPEVVRSWRVDQILTSELFDVPRARNAETERLFARRDELVDKVSRTSSEEAELRKLRLELSKLPTAQDPNDQKAMDFIRQAAALLKKEEVVDS